MMEGLLFSDILIADATVDFAREARTVLQSAGYIVRRAESGQAVLDAVVKSPPDLILLSSTLPDIDGYEVTRRLKHGDNGVFIPVIVLAEGDRQDDVAAALNAGADEVLSKPLSNAQLLVRVRAMLRLKRTTDALAELNATLEQKVQERTEALEKAHAQLRHAEKLSALGHLAASVAHDINNPLTAILNYIYLLEEDLPAGSAMREDLALIERQVLVIAQLVKQLQNFAKPSRQEKCPVVLEPIIEDIVRLTSKELQKRRINVVCECAADLPPVLAPPDQIGEVFMNLIVNARDAMPDGGTLTVRTCADDGHICALVSDTGTGIPPEVREHIFEPFYTTKGEKGTGLGLAICYRVVQDCNGEILVDSRPGEGATFEVRFPVAQVPA